MSDQKKIAIVYDWIDKWGGVERLLLTLHEMFPKAVFYTSYFDRKKAVWAKDLDIKTSFLQNFPTFIKSSRLLSFPFYPFVFENFDFNEYDLVISVTSSFAKSIITQPKTKHICILLTPTRYFWLYPNEYFKHKFIRDVFLGHLKKWDKAVSSRPDLIVSISKTVASRSFKYYKKKSQVIYPPFDLQYWQTVKSTIKPSQPSQDFFLVVSRLEPYKKIDLVIKVFNRIKEKLIVVGVGRELENLKKMSGNNITFLANISDSELASLYMNTKALIMPEDEDFGYVSLEAQFFGSPVIALNRGGAKETVIDGETGILFNNQTSSSLEAALERFKQISYNLRARIKETDSINVRRFDKKIFIEKLNSIL